MKFLLQTGLIAIASCATCAAGDSTVPTPPSKAEPLKLLFSGPSDISETWGQLHFGVTPVRKIADCPPIGFTVIASFPRADGGWDTFGQQMTDVTPSQRLSDHITTWKLVRSVTRDGVTFEPATTVYAAPAAAWTSHTAMAWNPEAKEYLLLRFKVDRGGFAYTPFLSKDGDHWVEEKAGFHDGDALSLFWSPVLHRYVCVSKSLQPYRKHIADHGGATPSTGDDELHDRRVLVFRTSVDGRTWEPSVSQTDIWNRDKKKDVVPSGFMTMPDENDPPDLEFYSGNAFWYGDRAYMLVLNYAASPLLPKKHGPQLDNEWWTSRDGLHWDRPARGLNALELFPGVVRLESAPIILNGQIVFARDPRASNLLLGMPIDRITYVGARANAEFSTRTFVMPQADLQINAAVPATDRSWAKAQAYLMVGVVGQAGRILPGFEPEKCLFQNQDGTALNLRWGDKSARELAGQKVRLRILLRSANVYAVTSAP